MGLYSYLYPHPKSAQVNFYGVKMTPERLFNSFIPPKNCYNPQNKFLATSLIHTHTVVTHNFCVCWAYLLLLVIIEFYNHNIFTRQKRREQQADKDSARERQVRVRWAADVHFSRGARRPLSATHISSVQRITWHCTTISSLAFCRGQFVNNNANC